jgi:hypothetical protein
MNHIGKRLENAPCMSGIACDSRVFCPDAVKPFRAFKHREGRIFRVIPQKEFGSVWNKDRTGEQDGTEMILVPRRNGIIKNIPKKIEARKRSDASDNPDEGIFLSFHFLFLLGLFSNRYFETLQLNLAFAPNSVIKSNFTTAKQEITGVAEQPADFAAILPCLKDSFKITRPTFHQGRH